MSELPNLKPEIKIEEMNQSPQLKEDELLIYSFPINGGPKMMAHVAITNKNLFIRPRGNPLNRISDSFETNVEKTDINLKDIIEIETQTGLTDGSLKIVTESDMILLNGFHRKYANSVLNVFDETTELKKHEQKKDSNHLRNAGAVGLGISGTVTSVVLIIVGLTFIGVGIMLSMTIVGVILGIPAIIVGVLILGFAGINGAAGIGLAGIGAPTKSTKMTLE